MDNFQLSLNIRPKQLVSIKLEAINTWQQWKQKDK